MGIKQYEKGGVPLFEVSVCIRDENGKRHRANRSNIKSHKLAVKVEKQLNLEVSKKMVEANHSGPTWKALVEGWELAARSNNLFKRQITPTTLNDHVGALNLHTATWMNIPADKISRADVHEVFSLMTVEGKSYARKKNVKSAINNVFEWSMDSGLVRGLTVSPARDISFGKRTEGEPEILNINEIRKLLQLAHQTEHPWYPVWAMALLTGMRNGELHALLWSDLDWANNLITVSKSYNSKTKSVKCTKNGLYRSVPMNSELLRLLKELRVNAKGRPEVLPRLPRWRNGVAARILQAFCSGYGIPPIRFHTLRACFATQLMRDNVPVPQVQKICGWADLKTTMRYVRLSGIEVTGATDCLKILPDSDVMARVVELYKGDLSNSGQ
jgi:integrase